MDDTPNTIGFIVHFFFHTYTEDRADAIVVLPANGAKPGLSKRSDCFSSSFPIRRHRFFYAFAYNQSIKSVSSRRRTYRYWLHFAREVSRVRRTCKRIFRARKPHPSDEKKEKRKASRRAWKIRVGLSTVELGNVIVHDDLYGRVRAGPSDLHGFSCLSFFSFLSRDVCFYVPLPHSPTHPFFFSERLNSGGVCRTFVAPNRKVYTRACSVRLDRRIFLHKQYPSDFDSRVHRRADHCNTLWKRNARHEDDTRRTSRNIYCNVRVRHSLSNGIHPEVASRQ